MVCRLDEKTIEADAIEISPGTYSILVAGKAFEAHMEPRSGALRVVVGAREFQVTVRDPRRWQRGRGGALETEGRQQVTAPMPGKIVSILVKQGDTVEAGQGLLVVEAMKMQNEVRSPKGGIVEHFAAREGQTVNSGDVLAVIA